MTNIEAQVISAICENKDIASVITADIDHMFVSHSDVWQGVKSYYGKYRSVPSVDILSERFGQFIPEHVSAPTPYYVDQLRDSYIGAKIKDILLSSGKSLQNESPSRVLEALQKETTALSRHSTAIRDIDVTDSALAEKHFDMVRERSAEMGGSPGILTGFKSIDVAYPTGLAPGHLCVLIGWPGRGKQEWVGKTIPTPNGYRRFGDLLPGDMVWGRDGIPTMVLAIHPQDSRKAMRVTFNDGTSGVYGPEHLWSVYCGKRGKNRDNLITMTTQEIKDRGLFRNRDGHKEYKAILPLPSPVRYDKVTLPLEPYTMGALIGDGYYGSKSSPVVISNNDTEIADLISERLPEYQVKEIKPGTSRRWSIQKLHRLFRENDWCATADSKRIPTVYMTAHYEARLELLRGLMDTDGYPGHGGRHAEFSQSNEVLANQFAELVRSLGGVAKVRETSRDGQWVVRFWTPDNPFNLKRKADQYTPERPMFKAFESIEPCDDAEMMCITVDADDSLYLSSDYTVTHNTWFSAYLAIKAWEQGFKPMIVSVEMSPEDMRNRIYSLMGSGLFNMTDLQRGSIDTDDFRSWSKKRLTDAQEFIIVSNDGVGDVTPTTIQAKIDQHRPDLVIVDYHQLLSDSKKSNSEVERNRNISRELKLMAVRNSLPVIDITAATMSDISDQDEPPLLSQVAWSKAIEYDADIAMAVHRVTDTDLMIVQSRKNRHGRDFAVYLDVDFGNGVIRENFDANV